MGYSPSAVIEFYEDVFIETTPDNKTERKYSAIERISIVDNKVVSSGTSLFTNPKFYKFKNPNLRYEIKDDEIIVYADNYAKFVEITSDEDVVLSDNYFDMFDGKKIVKILKGACKNLKLRSAYDIK